MGIDFDEFWRMEAMNLLRTFKEGKKMSDAEATIKQSILMGLSDHGGKTLRADNGEEMVNSIMEYLFDQSVLWALVAHINKLNLP